MTSVKGTKLAESTGWHYEIAIVVPNVDFKMRYFNKDGVFGLVHYREPKNPGGTGHSTTAVVDTNKGVMLYESIEDRNKTPNPDRVIHRVRVKGTFDENLKFSDITEGKGFVYESGDGFAVANDNQHQFWLYTVNGTKEQGFQFKRFENTAADKATVTEKKTECTSGKNCEGATDIGTTAEMKGLFFRTETAETAWKNYLDRKPVCEPATDGAAAIAYSTLLNNTGAFGKCD